MPMNESACTVGLIGAKGGVGTTVLASSLGWALAERGVRVVLLDLDRHGGQAALHLCERNAGPTLRDAMQVIDRLDDTLLDTLLTPCSPGLRLLPAPRQWLTPSQEPAVYAEQLGHLIETANQLADWVLLDLPPHAPLDPALAPLLARLDRIDLITEPSLPATFNARRSWEWLQAQRAEAHDDADAGCYRVLNKVHRQQALPSAQVWRTLGLGDEGAASGRELPRHDALVAQAIYQGQAVGALEPRDPLSRALGRWADELMQARTATRTAPTAATNEAPLPNPNPHPKPDTGSAAPWAGWRERLMRWAS